MSVTWNISDNVVLITINREGDGFGEAVVRAMASPDFPSHPSVLIDARSKTENPMADELRRRADRVAMLLSDRKGSFCAVVVGSRPNQYGLARMFSVFLGTEGVHAEIFTSIDEAKRWLTPTNGHKTGGAAG